jgi:Flp pilus assembly pilin Flp
VSTEREGVFIMIERFLDLTISDESGQTMAEYAVVLGVITIAVVVTLGLLSTAIQNLLNNVISVI